MALEALFADSSLIEKKSLFILGGINYVKRRSNIR